MLCAQNVSSFSERKSGVSRIFAPGHLEMTDFSHFRLVPGSEFITQNPNGVLSQKRCSASKDPVMMRMPGFQAGGRLPVLLRLSSCLYPGHGGNIIIDALFAAEIVFPADGHEVFLYGVI